MSSMLEHRVHLLMFDLIKISKIGTSSLNITFSDIYYY
jgi:hypothetical protein